MVVGVIVGCDDISKDIEIVEDIGVDASQPFYGKQGQGRGGSGGGVIVGCDDISKDVEF